MLSTEELRQQRRFYFERDRHRYLVTRAMVRTVLSKYAAIAPEQWRFTTNSYGRPDPSLGDRPEHWAFWQFAPVAEYLVAACIAVAEGGVRRLQLRRTVPLLQEVKFSCLSLQSSGVVQRLPSLESPLWSDRRAAS